MSASTEPLPELPSLSHLPHAAGPRVLYSQARVLPLGGEGGSTTHSQAIGTGALLTRGGRRVAAMLAARCQESIQGVPCTRRNTLGILEKLAARGMCGIVWFVCPSD